MNNPPPLVTVYSLAYNHAPFIRQYFDGILAQKCSFPFEVLIHDDCSTDGTTEIIREYEALRPDILKPIYQQQNQYSLGVKIGRTFIWPRVRGKYVALCEGDDYWTDPGKLQKMVDFLETHPEHSMCCHRVRQYHHAKGVFVKDCAPRGEEGDFRPEEVIEAGGLGIATCSLVYRRSVLDNYPEYCLKCHVGDYPLQIMCAMKGKCHYFNEPMGVYRVGNANSWVQRFKSTPLTEKKVKGIRSQVEMFKGFSLDFPQYAHIFKRRIALYMSWVLSKFRQPSETAMLKREFKDEIRQIPLADRILFFIMQHDAKRVYVWENRDWKAIRRFLFSFHLNSRGVCIQLFGLQIASKCHSNRPAFWRITVGK